MCELRGHVSLKAHIAWRCHPPTSTSSLRSGCRPITTSVSVSVPVCGCAREGVWLRGQGMFLLHFDFFRRASYRFRNVKITGTSSVRSIDAIAVVNIHCYPLSLVLSFILNIITISMHGAAHEKARNEPNKNRVDLFFLFIRMQHFDFDFQVLFATSALSLPLSFMRPIPVVSSYAIFSTCPHTGTRSPAHTHRMRSFHVCINLFISYLCTFNIDGKYSLLQKCDAGDE